MRHRQGRVQERGVKSGQGNYGHGGPLADRLQDDLSVAAAFVFLETQHRDPGLPGMLREALKIGLRFLGPQHPTEPGPAHVEAAIPERRPVVLGIAQATQVGVFDAGLGECLPEPSLAEALLAADRCKPYIRHDVNTAVEEGGDERVDVPAFVPSGPEAGSDLGLLEEFIEGDLKCLGDCSYGEETWLDRSLALQAGQRSYGDAGFLGEPLPRPPSTLPHRSHALGECSGVAVGTR